MLFVVVTIPFCFCFELFICWLLTTFAFELFFIFDIMSCLFEVGLESFFPFVIFIFIRASLLLLAKFPEFKVEWKFVFIGIFVKLVLVFFWITLFDMPLPLVVFLGNKFAFFFAIDEGRKFVLYFFICFVMLIVVINDLICLWVVVSFLFCVTFCFCLIEVFEMKTFFVWLICWLGLTDWFLCAVVFDIILWFFTFCFGLGTIINYFFYIY